MEGDTYFQTILEGSWTKLPEEIKPVESKLRNNIYLREKLDSIWSNHFKDIEKLNLVNIRFKGNWKNKFGHIDLKKDKSTEIVVNGFFKDHRIPEFIIDLTIAHELVHYSHGFQSPHKRLFKHPHQGGIVTKELKNRGFIRELKKEKKWLKESWYPLIEKEFPKRKRKRSYWF